MKCFEMKLQGIVSHETILLTVNMKCFEIKHIELSSMKHTSLTVNMKCFEIQNFLYNFAFQSLINRKHEMF